MPVKFGNKEISTKQLSDGRNVPVISMNTTGDFSISDKKLYVKGFPLTLAFNETSYALVVIKEPSANLDPTLELNQINQFLALSKLDNKNILTIEETGSNKNPTSELIFNGMPLSITSDNELVFIEETNTNVDEEAETFLAGIPVLVRRIGQNWHLVVHDS